VPEFPERPTLELDGWALGRPLEEFVSENAWKKRATNGQSNETMS
jgi:5,6-dimethylbenzimidazole synthase